MKLLFDTHTFIWWDSDSTKLSSRVFALCQDPTNNLLLSAASVWEMQIKFQLGKLTLRLPLADLIAHQQKTNNIILMEITHAHVLALEGLPMPHKDPFDRLLVTQANAEGAGLLSCDPIFAHYPVKVIW